MSLMDFLNARQDIKDKKANRQLRQNESAAKVNHADAEKQARLAAIELERARFDQEVQKWHIDTRYKQAILEEQIRAYREARAEGADTNFHGLQVRYRRAPVTVIEDAQQQEQAALPGRIDFIEILESWRPSEQQIFLGLAPGGQFLTVPLKALCHVALAGATDLGKSSLMRMLLSQLLYIGCYVAICDPHYTPLDAESGDDWRPIERRLAIEPAVSASEIKDVLKWAAATELPKRLERRRRSQPVGKPFFLAMDELPSIVKKVPEAPDYMTEIAREGRKVGLYLVTAAQDFMVKSIGSSAIRDNFRTAIYVGGDQTTARVLLDVNGRVDDGSLGKGVVMVRSQATPQASLMRVPYASNDSLYRLLPVNSRESVNDSVNGVDEPVEPARNVVNSTLKRLPAPQSDTAETFTPPPFGVTQKQLDQIRALHDAEVPLREICRIVKLDGRHYGAFREACKFLGIGQEGD